MIYFVAAFDVVKIGYSSGASAQRRVSSLQTSSPTPLTLLASIEGTRSEEIAAHLVLRDYRRKGEWFERQPAMDFMGDCIELGVAAATRKWAELQSRRKAERDKAAIEFELEIGQALMASIEAAIEKHGARKVIGVAEIDRVTLSNWRSGLTTPRPLPLLRLIGFDKEPFQSLFAKLGVRLEPLTADDRQHRDRIRLRVA